MKDHCFARLCYVEKRGALTHKHFHIVFKGNFSNLPMLDKKINVALVWDANPPLRHVVCCKNWTCKGLHNFLCMVGYSMKDNGEHHFEFVHYNVFAMIWMRGRWSVQNLRRLDQKIVWVCPTIMYCNMLTNGHVFVWRSILVLVFLGHCFTCLKVGNFI